jgi:hypothetical protein
VYVTNGIAGDNFQVFYTDNQPVDSVQQAIIRGYVRTL